MKFYDCSTAPSPRRARMFIAEKRLEIESVNIDMRAGEQLSPEFKAINPHCTVPVLEIDSGSRLITTAGIRRYLETLQPEPCLLGAGAEQQGVIADLIWHIEFDGFMGMAEALRNSAPGLKGRALTGPVEYEQIPALAERGKRRVQHFLEGVDEMIGDQPFVAGADLSAADIDLLIMIDFAGWLKFRLPEDASNARRWHDSMSARPSAKL